MKLVHGIFLGLAVLIALYLGLNNANGVASIFNTGGTQLVNETKTLQGR